MCGGGGDLIGHVRFYALAIAVGLIFSAVTATAATTISTNIQTGGTLTVTGLSSFGNASSTLFSSTNGLWVGSSGATSIFGSATSTFGAGISATYLNLSGTSASSTAANGINLTAGCFAVNGTCIGGSSGPITAVTGTWPIISSGGATPVISFGGLSTSTASVIGNIPYFSGVNTFANVATSSPLGTYPLQISGAGALVGSATTFSLAFGTTTSNTWAGTQTFTNNPVLGSLTGLVAGNSGTLYQVASSSLFGFTPISNALTKGYFLVGDDAGTAQATSTIFISSMGKVGIGATTPTAFLHLKAGTTAANTAPLKFTTQASGLNTVEQGAMELIGNSLQFTQLAKRRGVAMSQNVRVSDTTLAASSGTAESSAIVTAEHGANYLEAGKMEEIIVVGTMGQRNNANAVLTVRVKYAGSTVLTFNTSANAAIAANSSVLIRVYTTCRTTGATGTMQINAVFEVNGEATNPQAAVLATIDTTTAQDTTVTLQWGSDTDITNTITINQARVLTIEDDK